jgi:uncharacterized delta-60 repeat protein
MYNKNYKVFLMSCMILVLFSTIFSPSSHFHSKVYALANQPGDLDPTFDGDGLVTTAIGSFHVRGKAVAIQSDGKIVVAGTQFITHVDGEFVVVRYNNDGSLDTTFNYDGIVTTNISNYRDDIVNDIFIQEDGKIVIVGYSVDNANIDAVVWALVRFNPDGSLDASFDGDGKVTTDLGPFHDTAKSAAIQSDGKIVVVGFTNSISQYDGLRKSDIAVVRYNTNGSLDTSFGTNGIVITESQGGLSSSANSVAIQSDGRIVVAGEINGMSDLALIRYNNNGSVDTSFDGDGIRTINAAIASEPPKIALHNGKIVFVSYRYFDRYFYIARFNHDGSLDASFDSDGQVITSFNYAIALGDVAIQSDGKILITGSGVPVDNLDFLLMRYLENGSLDSSFGTNGVLTTDFGTKQGDLATDIGIQSDEKIIVVGHHNNSTQDVIEVARYLGAYVYFPPTFTDVPNPYWAWSYIEQLYAAGITSGCNISPLQYCPTTTVTRDQMAVFLLRGKHSSSYMPPEGTGTFGDVPDGYWAEDWIEQLAEEGITFGCGSGNYCPTHPVTRDQMAIFLLRAKHGSDYNPPEGTGVFGDVQPDYWAADWIEQLAEEGITSGCGGGNYCPTTPVTRDQMAVFLVRTFNLP